MALRDRTTADDTTPFWMSMRAAERRIYREALEATGGEVDEASQLLGIPQKRFTQRARYIGGVFENDPIHEPPQAAAKRERPTPAISDAHSPKVRAAIAEYHATVADDDDDDDDESDDDIDDVEVS